MTKLSPAAQAVLDSVKEICPAPADEIAAAALRAVADQMRYTDQFGLTGFGGYTQAQDQILAIADELETNY